MRGWLETGLDHSDGLENLLAGVVGQRLPGQPAHDLAQQDKVDVAVDHFGAGQSAGLVDQRFADAGFVAAPGGRKVEIGAQAGEMRQQVADGDGAVAALELGEICGDGVVQPDLPQIEKLHQARGGRDHFGERRGVEDGLGRHRFFLGEQGARTIRFAEDGEAVVPDFDHGPGDELLRDGVLNGGIDGGGAWERGLGAREADCAD